MNLENVLHENFLFEDFKEKEKELFRSLFDSSHLKFYPKGRNLLNFFSKNSTKTYYVTKGACIQYKNIDIGNENKIINQDLIVEDEIFGIKYLDNNFDTNIKTIKDSYLLAINKKKKEKLCEEVFSFKKYFSEIDRNKNKRMDRMTVIKDSSFDVEKRLNYLMDFAFYELGAKCSKKYEDLFVILLIYAEFHLHFHQCF